MNEERFTGKAEVYKKHRPSYADKFIEYLYSEIGFKKGSIIADIGAGTGIFSEILLKKDSFVYLVEPNSDMFEAAKKNMSAYLENKRCEFVNAPAERTALADNSIDFITAAQAFHWFDRESFKNECIRILKPNGKVILVWNVRVLDSGFIIENDEINRKYCDNYKGFSAGHIFDNSEEYKGFFKKVEYREFENNLYFDLEGFTGRNLSSSYAPKIGTETAELYSNELETLFYKYEKNGKVMMPNITVSYVGEF